MKRKTGNAISTHVASIFCMVLLGVSLFSMQVWAGGAMQINGAGATFPYPLYAKWMYEYSQMYGVRINYQSIGSGGGIAQIKAKTVDFGASDAPLSSADLDKSGLIQFPMILGGLVLGYNLPGVEKPLRLSRECVAQLFLGKITYWDDPIITKSNPGVSLPHHRITIVHRADGSGTTWIFTNYLDKISPQWHEQVGYGKAVKWPTGIGGKGNEGVSAYIKRVKGAIGYIEYAYALENHIPVASLQNKNGSYVMPSTESFQAAAANADWAHTPGFAVVLTDQAGAESWPITGASFILIYKKQGNWKLCRTLLDFFSWCYSHGDDTASSLHYIPIPDTVVRLVKKVWKDEIVYSDNK